MSNLFLSSTSLMKMENQAEVRLLFLKRRQVIGKLTRVYDDLVKAEEENTKLTMPCLRVYSKNLTTIYEEYNRNHDAIIASIPEECFEEQDEKYWEFEDQYNQTSIMIERMIVAIEMESQANVPACTPSPSTYVTDVSKPPVIDAKPCYDPLPTVDARHEVSSTAIVKQIENPVVIVEPEPYHHPLPNLEVRCDMRSQSHTLAQEEHRDMPELKSTEIPRTAEAISEPNVAEQPLSVRCSSDAFPKSSPTYEQADTTPMNGAVLSDIDKLLNLLGTSSPVIIHAKQQRMWIAGIPWNIGLYNDLVQDGLVLHGLLASKRRNEATHRAAFYNPPRDPDFPSDDMILDSRPIQPRVMDPPRPVFLPVWFLQFDWNDIPMGGSMFANEPFATAAGVPSSITWLSVPRARLSKSTTFICVCDAERDIVPFPHERAVRRPSAGTPTRGKERVLRGHSILTAAMSDPSARTGCVPFTLSEGYLAVHPNFGKRLECSQKCCATNILRRIILECSFPLLRNILPDYIRPCSARLKYSTVQSRSG